jgi:hypothetical protein
MTQKKLMEAGYRAALAGKPCQAPTARERERAAWEQGWRAGHAAKGGTEARELYAFHTGVRPLKGARIFFDPGDVFPRGVATARAEYVITEVAHQGDGAFLIDIKPVEEGR